jgi:hypothetical protein
VSRHKGTHGGKPKPGNPGYRADSGNYEGKHKGGVCGLIALPAAGAALGALGAVLAILWRAVG